MKTHVELAEELSGAADDTPGNNGPALPSLMIARATSEVAAVNCSSSSLSVVIGTGRLAIETGNEVVTAGYIKAGTTTEITADATSETLGVVTVTELQPSVVVTDCTEAALD